MKILNKKKIFFVALIVSLFNIATVKAGLLLPDIYTGVKFSWADTGISTKISQNNSSTSVKSKTNTSSKDGRYWTSVVAGTKISKFTFEAEYLYEHNLFKITTNNSEKKISSNTVFGNMYYDIFSFAEINLCANAGLGVSHMKTNYLSDTNNPAYNLGCGISIETLPLVSFDFGYRYIDFGKPKLAMTNKKVHLYNNSVFISMRFGF